MIAPDPGLTDLVAAHLTELIADAPAPNHEEDNYDAGYVAALADLRDSAAFTLVVEQHTKGRIAETVKSTGQRMYAQTKKWQERAETWIGERDHEHHPVSRPDSGVSR